MKAKERAQRLDGSEIPAVGHDLMRDLMRLAERHRDAVRGYCVLALVDDGDTTASVVRYTNWDSRAHLIGCLTMAAQQTGFPDEDEEPEDASG